jgi:hypothetical protein
VRTREYLGKRWSNRSAGGAAEIPASRCREGFMVRFTGTLERLAIGRLLILVHAFDVMDSPRAAAPRLCLHVLSAGRILSHFFGAPTSRTRRIPKPGTQTAEGGNDDGTAAEELRCRGVPNWFRRICRGCDLLFWRWEKHGCAACLKRRGWREELQARWHPGGRPPADHLCETPRTVLCGR